MHSSDRVICRTLTNTSRERTVALVLVVSVVLTSVPWLCGAEAEESEWLVGLATTKITPTQPLEMVGYSSRKGPFESVEDDLYLKAIAFEDRQGQRGIWITADHVGWPSDLAQPVCDRIQARTGLPRKAILLNASHTHTGPHVSARLAGGLSDEGKARVRAYSKELEDRTVAAALQALERLSAAQLSWGSGVVPFITNRREVTKRGIVLGHNGRGPADRSLPVLRVTDPEGELRAVVFGAAAHPTTLTGRHRFISGDYPGYAQTIIEEKYPGVQAMFMLGCAGDANPYPKGKLEFAKRHGRELAEEVSAVLEQRRRKLQPVHGPLAMVLETVDLPLQTFSGRAAIEALGAGSREYRRYFVNGALSLLDRGESLPTYYTAPFAVWRFGDDLTLVGFSGETLVGYALRTEKALGSLNLWVAGYCNDLYGYLPPASVIREGGYESRGLYVQYGLFAPEVEDVVMDAIKRLAARVGREVVSEAGSRGNFGNSNDARD